METESRESLLMNQLGSEILRMFVQYAGLIVQVEFFPTVKNPVMETWSAQHIVL